MVAVACHSSQEHSKCHGHLERAIAAERLRALVSEQSEDLKPGSDSNSFSSAVKFSCRGDFGNRAGTFKPELYLNVSKSQWVFRALCSL